MAAHTSLFDDLASLEPITSPITPKAASSPQTTSDSAQYATTSCTTPRHDKANGPTHNEQNYDLFSTLFSPSTPHASPILGTAELLPEEPHRKQPPRPLHYRSPSMSSQSSDFGAFVSVSDFDDPLSAGFDDFQDDLQEPMTATPTNPNMRNSSAKADEGQNEPTRSTSRASSSTHSTSQSLQRSRASNEPPNPTLSFFDQFAQDAKERSNKRSSVLTELLLHEDDPLYFLKDSCASAPPKSPLVDTQPDLISSPEPIVPSTSTATIKAPTPPLTSDMNVHHEFDLTHDVDHHYFRVPPSSSVLRPTPYSPPQPHTTPSTQGSRPHPTRSPSIAVADPKPAAPITSVGLAAGSPGQSASSSPAVSRASSHDGTHDHNHSPEHREPGLNPPQNPSLTRAQSSSSLSGSFSTLSGKWMPTFLRGAGSPGTSPGTGNGGARPALESLFQDPHAATEPHTQPHHAQTLPFSSSASHAPPRPAQAPPTFTHTSAFAAAPPPAGSALAGLPSLAAGAALTHGPSPFAPHVYVPPSGAPGYAGEGYAGARAWDKGFSDALEREMRGNPSPTPADAQPVQGLPRARTQTGGSAASGPGDRNDGDGQGASGPSASGNGRSGWGSGFFGSLRGRSATGGDAGAASASARTASLPVQNARPVWDAFPAGGANADAKANRNSSAGLGAFIEKKTGKVELLGRREMTTPVLSPELATDLRPYLPALARLPKNWTLIYSLDQNGISLNTLYSRCEAHSSRRPAPGEMLNTSMLVVVKDADGAVFGAWLADGIRGGKGGRGYFGGGESFLWKNYRDKLQIFKCTGKNNYVALCEPEYISFGGGDGHYGLYLDETLYDGSSAPCPTFNNEPLCSPGPKKGSTVTFECVGLEIWGMGP